MSEFKEYFEKYKIWVKANPMGAANMESAIKLGSYIISGRFNNSTVLWEILYSGSKLLEMFNDHLIKDRLPDLSDGQINKLRIFLNVLEYSEVILEICAQQIWGPAGKWAVVGLIQLVKMMWRGFLLFKCKVKLLGSPALSPINRRDVGKQVLERHQVLNAGLDESSSFTKLQRSGRLLRKIGFTPARHRRTYSPIKDPEICVETCNNELTVQEYMAEALHICRPVVHLGSMYVFGEKSWVPYLTSLSIDATSLHLHQSPLLNKEEELVLLSRYFNMLFYLVRDPLFSRYTHSVIHNFLHGVRVPLFSSFCLSVLNYLPEWQKTYAYAWS